MSMIRHRSLTSIIPIFMHSLIRRRVEHGTSYARSECPASKLPVLTELVKQKVQQQVYMPLMPMNTKIILSEIDIITLAKNV